MRGFRHPERHQGSLLPVFLEDWVPADDLCLVVSEVLEQVDLSEVLLQYGSEGQPAYCPRMMLGLWIYGYARGLYSSRKIAEAIRRDVCFVYLAGRLQPDHCTLARFRQRHSEQLVRVMVGVVQVMRQMGVGLGGLVAIDGTKLKANARQEGRRGKGAGGRQGEEEERWVRQWAEQALARSEEEDAREDAEYGAQGDGRQVVPQELRERGRRKEAIQAALKQRERLCQAEAAVSEEQREGARQEKAEGAKGQGREEEEGAGKVHGGGGGEAESAVAGRSAARGPSGEASAASERMVAARENEARQSEAVAGASAEEQGQEGQQQQQQRAAQAESKRRRGEVDRDARWMLGRQGYQVAYNAQIAVSESGLIVAAEVCSDASDTHQLCPMVEQVERLAGAEAAGLTMVADSGYYSAHNLAAVADKAVVVDLRREQRQGEAIRLRGGMSHEEFWYDEQQDLYHCPAGRRLRLKKVRQRWRAGRPYAVREYQSEDCSGCALRSRCIGGRNRLKRLQAVMPEGARSKMQQRLRTALGRWALRRRKAIVEPVFGAIKHNLGFRHFMLRGLRKVRGEWALVCTAMNMIKFWLKRKAGQLLSGVGQGVRMRPAVGLAEATTG